MASPSRGFAFSCSSGLLNYRHLRKLNDISSINLTGEIFFLKRRCWSDYKMHNMLCFDEKENPNGKVRLLCLFPCVREKFQAPSGPERWRGEIQEGETNQIPPKTRQKEEIPRSRLRLRAKIRVSLRRPSFALSTLPARDPVPDSSTAPPRPHRRSKVDADLIASSPASSLHLRPGWDLSGTRAGSALPLPESGSGQRSPPQPPPSLPPLHPPRAESPELPTLARGAPFRGNAASTQLPPHTARARRFRLFCLAPLSFQSLSLLNLTLHRVNAGERQLL